jgi:flavorubredoxin
MAVTTAGTAVEIVPSKLYALGEIERLDGRISWVPRDERGYQWFNTYLLIEGRHALVVDPGVAKHCETILRQLGELLPRDPLLDVYVTRTELDCGENVRAIASSFPVRKLYSGGILANPFAGIGIIYYASSSDPDDTAVDPPYAMERCPVGASIQLGPARRLEVVNAALRVLACYWLYDTGTATLFTSDGFGHATSTDRDGPRVVRTASETGDRRKVERHLFMKFDWLLEADTAYQLSALDKAFNDRRVDRIAPDHGAIIEGADLVRAQYETVRALIVERGGTKAP